jgi:hypothetical protein
MLGSNPSADSVAKTEVGRLIRASPCIIPSSRDWHQSDKSWGRRGEAPALAPTTNSEFPFFDRDTEIRQGIFQIPPARIREPAVTARQPRRNGSAGGRQAAAQLLIALRNASEPDK